MRRGYCLENPAQKTSQAKVVDKPPGILMPEQCVGLLEAACSEILPAIALGLFAGLRPESEVWRLDWRDLDLEAGLIRIEAAKTKSARYRLVEMSENLKLWLLPYRKPSGPISPSGDRYHYLLQSARKSATEAAIKAGKPEQGIVKWPADALRHCYGSYHYAKFQDPGKTMVQMGHYQSADVPRTLPRPCHACGCRQILADPTNQPRREDLLLNGRDLPSRHPSQRRPHGPLAMQRLKITQRTSQAWHALNIPKDRPIRTDCQNPAKSIL